MGVVGQNDAPYRHISVKPEINSGGMPVCDGCAFDDGLNVYQACYECASYNRMGEKDVIFKPAQQHSLLQKQPQKLRSMLQVGNGSLVGLKQLRNDL